MASDTGTQKIIQLKKLPKWLYYSPLKMLNEKEAIAWANCKQLYYWKEGKLWIVKATSPLK